MLDFPAGGVHFFCLHKRNEPKKMHHETQPEISLVAQPALLRL